MSIKDRLYDKMQDEFDSLIEEMKRLPPDKIIEKAYEKVIKEDILACFDNDKNFSDEETQALYNLKYPLDELYQRWQGTDVSYLDVIRNSIDDSVGKLLSEIDTEQTLVNYNRWVNGGQEPEIEIVASQKTPLPSTQVINGELIPGDWVISAPNNDYGCLVGMVMSIDKLGTPQHDTDNPGDDIHINFMAVEYSGSKEAELFEIFDHLEPRAASFSELPLDDVIMAPDMLVRVTELGLDEIYRLANDYSAAEAYCNSFVHGNEKKEVRKPPEKSVAKPKKSLEEKIKAAKEKADAFNAQKNENNSTKKRGVNEL